VWQPSYAPLGSLAPSAVGASLPVLALLLLLGVLRRPAWTSALVALATGCLMALFVYGMPAAMVLSAVSYGVAFGLFPIAWVLFAAILLYKITLDAGQFEVLKDSVGRLTGDRRLQILLVGFSFGAFLEGAAGFGAPVAVAAAMLSGLGHAPFEAASLCLLANTAPVAFGSIGIPILTLAGTTGLPLQGLSSMVGRICAPVSLIVPAYLIVVMSGWRGMVGVLPAVLVCGGSFALMQLWVSNAVGPQLTDILSSLFSILALVALFKLWGGPFVEKRKSPYSSSQRFLAWLPYVFLVAFVLLWGMGSVKSFLERASFVFPWPGLHNRVERFPPAVVAPGPYPALYTFNILSASGTSCFLAAVLSAFTLGVRPGRFARVSIAAFWQLRFSFLTIALVLGLAFLMNYSGATATLGLAFAETGRAFPAVSAFLGWLGVFLTGSDTSSNALFGNLQVITARRLGLSGVLMAASNSSGGVMGKMISLQNIAVAAASAGMRAQDEARLFRFTFRHSLILTSAMALMTLFYLYIAPRWVS